MAPDARRNPFSGLDCIALGDGLDDIDSIGMVTPPQMNGEGFAA
jgi:hypothetical protein